MAVNVVNAVRKIMIGTAVNVINAVKQEIKIMNGTVVNVVNAVRKIMIGTAINAVNAEPSVMNGTGTDTVIVPLLK